MMDFYFENQGTNTYLVYKLKPEDAIDTLSLGMLTNNKILGLAQTQFMQMDADKYIKYNVSAHISVKQFFEGSVNKKRLVGVFQGIVNALLSAEDYMIETNSIVIDLNYMFADVSTCETVLICWPIIGADHGQSDLGAFFKNIMFSTQFDQTENCDYVAKIINYLNSATIFSLTEFKNILDGLDSVAPAPKAAPQKQPVVTNPTPAAAPAQRPPLVQPKAPAPTAPKAPAPVAPVVKPAPAPAPVAPKAPAPKAPAPKAPTHPAPKAPPVPTRMAVPGAPAPAPAKTQAPAAQNGEQEMSWFYLMQHYNKENAEIYNAQKAAKKAAKGGAAPAPAKTQAPAAPKAPAPAQAPVAKPVAAQPTPTAPQAAAQPAFVPREVPQGMNFGDTTVLSAGIGETTVLNAAQAPAQAITPHLIRKKTSEKISINKPVYRIGKERSYVDYFMGDNTAISRSHANIISRDGSYYIIDTNSTNHTFVNGNMVNSNVEVQINHGDTIRLANEDFDFKLY